MFEWIIIGLLVIFICYISIKKEKYVVGFETADIGQQSNDSMDHNINPNFEPSAKDVIMEHMKDNLIYVY